MEKTTKVINYNDHNYLFVFVNETKNTRNVFSHNTQLFLNDSHLDSGKVNYLNRTWEPYQYQTSMYQSVQNYLNATIERYKRYFLEKNNYKRMTKERKKEFDSSLNERVNIQVLRMLLKAL